MAAVLLATTSCSGESSDLASSEIIILSGRDDSVGGQRAELVDSWNRTHEMKARIVELTGSADQQHNEMLKEAQASDSRVDVFNLDVTWTAQFADAGYVTELDVPRTWTNSWPARSRPLDTVARCMRCHSTPTPGCCSTTGCLVGCPANWDAIGDEVERVLGRPQPRPAAVSAGQLREYDGLVVNVLETLHALTLDKGDLFDPGSRRCRRRSTPRPRRRPGPCAARGAGFRRGGVGSGVASRQGGHARSWPVAHGTLTAPSPENSTTGTNIAFCQLPGSGAVLGGQNLAVSSRSAHLPEAQELVQYLTSCEAEQTLFEQGGLAPTRACAYETSRRDDFTQAIEEAVENARPRPQGPCYSGFSGLFSKAVHRSMVTGDPLPSGFLDDLRRALDCKPPRQ